MAVTDSNNAVKVLWTGGWDSTFQILRALLLQKSIVTPYYLVDSARKSTQIELKRMDQIKEMLFKDHPFTRDLIMPTQFYEVSQVSENKDITATFKSLIKDKFIGSQYEWLARFCEQNNVSNLQLCIHKDDKAHFVIHDYIIESKNEPDVFLMDEKYKDTREYKIFNYFSFPILEYTKVEMAEISEKNNWNKYMKLTWFCHRPTAASEPCGICNPCRYTIKEGLGWRIPLHRRIIGSYYVNVVFPLKSAVKKVLK
jgi:7-cyano-7-deazaguanine synthase in queuosine biosynthesis